MLTKMCRADEEVELQPISAVPEGQQSINIVQVGKLPQNVAVELSGWTVLRLKTHCFPTEVAENKKIRLIYRVYTFFWLYLICRAVIVWWRYYGFRVKF